MIHDDLIRHFRGNERPELSPDFAASLRDRVRSLDRNSALDVTLRRWTPRLYWLGSSVVLALYLPSVPLTIFQIAGLAASAAVIVRVLQRALRARPLALVLHEAIWR